MVKTGTAAIFLRSGAWRGAWLAAATLMCLATPVAAQTTPVWPEVDAYVRLNDTARIFFLATTVQEGRNTTEGEFGVHLDLNVDPLRRDPTLLFRLDESKNRVLSLRMGYHYLPSYTGGSNEQRGVLEATARAPLLGWLGALLLSDRNRADLRVVDGTFSWRYRNRASIERELSIGRVRMNPYARFEGYYDSRFEKFSRTEAMAGSSFPLTGHWEVEAYFDSVHDTGGSPNRTTRAVGLVTTLYF
jgi:hypothetical protein